MICSTITISHNKHLQVGVIAVIKIALNYFIRKEPITLARFRYSKGRIVIFRIVPSFLYAIDKHCAYVVLVSSCEAVC